MTAPEPSRPRDEEIDVHGATHVGKVRATNEDQFLIASLRKQMKIHRTSLPEPHHLPLRGDRLAFLAIVADGVGGLDAGEEASRMAVETIVRYVTRSMHCYYAGDPAQEGVFLEQLRESVLEGHATVLARAEGEQREMATTVTLLMAIWPRAYVVQVGDSRCYRLRGGVLEQLTRDQTVAQELIEEGRPAEAHQWRHVLTSAVGGPRAVPEVTRLDLERRDVLLICSDGLADYVSEEIIRRRLTDLRSARQACEDLIQDALEAGGRDNVTVIVGRVKAVGE